MKDFTIAKPAILVGYPIHRAVAALVQGAPHLWRDNGDSLTIRTHAHVAAAGEDLPHIGPGQVRLFKLRASVGSKTRGHHRYARQGDHLARRQWLERQGQRCGFDLLAVHSSSKLTQVQDGVGRNFVMDATDFTGVLKVSNPEAFTQALRNGVGATGKAFGFSLLAI